MAGLQAGAPTPSDITVHSQSRQLQVCFSDGADFRIPFELMRVAFITRKARYLDITRE